MKVLITFSFLSPYVVYKLDALTNWAKGGYVAL